MGQGTVWCYLEAKNLLENIFRDLPWVNSEKGQLQSTKILFITGTFSRYISLG